MVKRTVSFLIAYIIVAGLVTAWVSSVQTKLFSDIPWMFSITIVLGAIAGLFTAVAKTKNAGPYCIGVGGTFTSPYAGFMGCRAKRDRALG